MRDAVLLELYTLDQSAQRISVEKDLSGRTLKKKKIVWYPGRGSQGDLATGVQEVRSLSPPESNLSS